jgi:hypothetical protein
MSNSTPQLEICEPIAVGDSFCEALVRIEWLGSCRRLVFAVTDRCGSEQVHNVVAKLVVRAELMADLAQMLAADRPEPAFSRLPINAVAN